MNSLSRFLLPVALFFLAVLPANADWLTYLHDHSRVGFTPETLTAPLVSRWEYTSPTAPKLAWPGEDGRKFETYEMTNRGRFDEVFHTAIAGGRIFIGSDDGHADCLDAATGKLIWNLRAGPNDELILARGRMTSRWPVRTGVLVDGTLAYFGADVFPHENVVGGLLDDVGVRGSDATQFRWCQPRCVSTRGREGSRPGRGACRRWCGMFSARRARCA